MDQPKDIMEKEDWKSQETWNDSAKESRHMKKAIPEGGRWTEVHTQGAEGTKNASAPLQRTPGPDEGKWSGTGMELPPVWV